MIVPLLMGCLFDSGDDAPVMKDLGFTMPVATGSCCSIFEKDGVAMSTRSTPGEPPSYHFFDLAGEQAGDLRRVLGTIGTQTSLEVDIETWHPQRAP